MHPKPNALVESLQRHDVYPHKVESIRVLQTHISWVILTGTFAYKIKKPVDLGFVDFSTLAKREFCCREELRLNGRLAPQLYLGVVPICGTADRPVIDGTGEPIEYAVKMKEFPQAALLDRVLQRGELQPDDISRVAAQVARFHSQIEVASANTTYGDSQSIWQSIDESLQQLLKRTTDPAWRSRIDNLQDWISHEFGRLPKTLANRRANGFIRECHGDMHLGNMILDGHDIVIFDGIEFSLSLRWIDVMSEVAFLVMDLEHRSHCDGAYRFLNAYLERTGDYAGLEVLPLYLVYRALVRAKVDAIRSQQSDLDKNQRQAIVDEFHGYIELAERFTNHLSPQLLITHGVSGSGKTTATQPLVEKLRAIRIRSDVELKRAFGFAALDRTDSCLNADLYSSANKRRNYERLADLSRTVLQSGFSVIVDATFLKRADRMNFRKLADELGVPFAIVACSTSPELLRRRITERQMAGVDASEATIAVLEGQLRSIEPLGEDERVWQQDETRPNV